MKRKRRWKKDDNRKLLVEEIVESSPSPSFHSAAQSFSSGSSSLVGTPLPPSFPMLSEPNSAFADPPTLPSTFHNAFSDDTSSRGTRKDLSPRVRCCDVFIGVSGGKAPQMFRFVRWLRAELEMQGISCNVANRGLYKSACSHEVARVSMDAATFGVVVITGRSFSNPYCIEEIKMFLVRRRLLPIFFEFPKEECSTRDIVERRGDVWERYGGEVWEKYGGSESEWREAVNGLLRLDIKLEAHGGNFRDCISEAVVLLASGLGRTASGMKSVKRWKEMATEEFPFPRNPNFIGRKKELLELEYLLFGYVEGEMDISTENRSYELRIKEGMEVRKSVEKQSEECSRKGKQPMICKESREEIEMQSHDGKKDRKTAKQGRTNSSKDLAYRKGLACISGASGIGKTELLLEFAYRFRQRYKMILWVGGESRFFCQNYMKLLNILGVDVDLDNMFFSERNGRWTFDQIEKIAILMVKRELIKDIPYLLVIDNLEREKDWWDGRNVMDLLPRFVGATHVIISTRLPHVAGIRPMRLLYLSGAEAMTLMKGSTSEVSTEDSNALRLIEEKLGRLPLGLALAGAVLSELPMNATKLLQAVNGMPYREVTWSEGEDVALRRNPFLVQLLDFCFSICERKPGKLAMRMVQASDLFAPSSVPMSMLALAAREDFRGHHGLQLWGKCTSVFMTASRHQRLDAEALAFLIKFQIGRTSTNSLCISFHDVVKLYAHKRGNDGVADSVVRAVSIEGSIPQQLEHIWAACFLLFKFGSDPVAVHLSINDLLSFIEQFVLPLGRYCANSLFRCNAVLELLRCASKTLETLEESFLADDNNGQNKSSCFCGSRSTIFFVPHVYQKFVHLRATLLETRANLMLRGSLYDIGKKLYRTAVSIKEVIYGWEHPETVASRETLERIQGLSHFLIE